MTKRRIFVMALAAGALVAPFGAAVAQRPARVFQVGYVGNSSPSVETGLIEAFRLGLRERGYTEGKDIVIHYRWAQGRIDLLPGQ